ncbi:trimeric intracellular cation channel family protein [Cellulomonas denverensis]|uniref:trimeric intracellular cation channel family protein n=1 Tax=Cellulomonas denverensis TaxID=264297 RepID=UPI001EF20939|nr:trimeric intracellular cation channel family protein [Cellulomonas denverensis]
MDLVLPGQMVMELLGVFLCALSGGLAAVRKSFDIFGIVVLAWLSGLGGGLIRDVLIGAVPPVGISSWPYVATAVFGGIVTWALHFGLGRVRRLVLVLDAGALGLFTAVGTVKALQYGAGPLAAVFCGAITAIGGGVLRDLFTGEVPIVFNHRELYAVPSVLGAAALTVASMTGVLDVAVEILVVLAIIVIRLVTLRLRWEAPTALTPPVRGPRPSRAPSLSASRLLRGGRSGSRPRVAGERRTEPAPQDPPPTAGHAWRDWLRAVRGGSGKMDG